MSVDLDRCRKSAKRRKKQVRRQALVEEIDDERFACAAGWPAVKTWYIRVEACSGWIQGAVSEVTERHSSSKNSIL